MDPSEYIMNYFYKILEWDLHKYLIPEKRLSSVEIEKKLKDCSDNLHDRGDRNIGYQLNNYFNHTDGIGQFLDLHINNIGDPFQKGTYLLNVKEIEYAVVRYYAKLWGAPLRNIEIDSDPHTKLIQKDDVYWGYVLSMGSSEGNIMSCWMARDYVGGKYLIIDKEKSKITPQHLKITKNEKGVKHFDELKETVFFTSTAAHYSVVKAAVLMNLSSFSHYGNEHYADAEIPGVKKKNEPFPDMVPVYTDMDGRVDPDKLAALVEFFAAKHHGIMVVLNYGTTFTGAFDEVELCCEKLKKIFDKHNLHEICREIVDPTSKQKVTDKRTGYWIHVDGAYGGAYLPYIAKHYQGKPEELVDTVITEEGKKVEYRAKQIPTIDMTAHPGISSVVTSGHKFPGAPWPCGVYMTRHKYQLFPPSSPMYIGSMDSTLSGSRNGVSAIIFWKYLSENSDDSITEECMLCLRKAQEMESELRKIVEKKNKAYGLKLKVSRGPFGLGIILSKLREAIASKYTLAEQDLYGEAYNHMFVFKHLANRPEVFKSFLEDVSQEFSFEEELEKLDLKLIDPMHPAHADLFKKRHRKKEFRLGHGKC